MNIIIVLCDLFVAIFMCCGLFWGEGTWGAGSNLIPHFYRLTQVPSFDDIGDWCTGDAGNFLRAGLNRGIELFIC